MQFKTWQEFFEKLGPEKVTVNTMWDATSFEEFYQHFKARLMDEVVANLATKEIYRDGNRYDVRVDNRELPLKNKGE